MEEPKPPTEPLPQECCGNGCQNCVWITYFEENMEYMKNLELYKNQQKEKENEKNKKIYLK
jgi:hypothetical protein